MSDKSIFELRERALEARYFETKNQALIEKLRAVFHKAVDRESLREATGITDETVLDRLVELQLNGEVMAAFKLVPVIEVAWADHAPDARTRRAVLETAVKFGVDAGSPAYAMLERRLGERPPLEVRKIWRLYAEALRATLTPQELAEFREDLLKFCRDVAEASGGVLGVFLKTSAAEQRVIDAVKDALS